MSGLGLGLLGEADAEEMDRLHRSLRPLSPDLLAYDFARPETFQWIGARDPDGALVGMHRLVHLSDLSLHRHIFVSPSARGRGIGTALLERGVVEAKRRGSCGTVAWVWDRDGERDLLEGQLGMTSGARRYVRFRVPVANESSGSVRIEPASASGDLAARLSRGGVRGELGVPSGDEDRGGFALAVDDAGSPIGAFRYVSEHRSLSIVDPVLVDGAGWLDLILAARVWAAGQGLQMVDLPTPAASFLSLAPAVQAIGGRGLNRHLVGLCWRRW